jgi:two-component system, LytTR family, sensor kinase
MKKSVVIMFHLFFWIFSSLLIILGFQLLTIPAHIFGGGGPGVKEQLFALMVALPIGSIIFYLSYFTLHYFVKKPVRFVWLTVGYLILTSGQLFFDFYKNNNSEKLLDILITLFPVLYFNAFGFLFRTFIEWVNDRKIKAELEKDRLESQLELLKSQINPHFLFNSLNNIDVLILDEPEKASAFLKKLSEILRFMLYDSNTERIPLRKEIDYINKYIDLQKIRTSNDNFVQLEISGDTESKFIAPMIFIHFIENAFKFASNKKIENAISIKLAVSENQLSFFCKNHINSNDTPQIYKNGLGMNLIRKRLDILYQKNYSLSINEKDNWYIVNLDIPV